MVGCVAHASMKVFRISGRDFRVWTFTRSHCGGLNESLPHKRKRPANFSQSSTTGSSLNESLPHKRKRRVFNVLVVVNFRLASMKVFRISGRDWGVMSRWGLCGMCLNESLPHKRKRPRSVRVSWTCTASPQ